MERGSKRAFLLGGITAFALMYINKESSKTKMKNTKTKAKSYIDSQKFKPNLATKTGFSDPQDPDDNRMVEEGAMTSVQYFNENVQDNNSKSESKKAYPKSHKKKLPETEESLPGDNNDSPAKQENHTQLEGTSQKS